MPGAVYLYTLLFDEERPFLHENLLYRLQLYKELAS